jgi:hypothetical protein
MARQVEVRSWQWSQQRHSYQKTHCYLVLANYLILHFSFFLDRLYDHIELAEVVLDVVQLALLCIRIRIV